MDRLEAGERLPDAVRGVADIDHRQRVLPDDFEAAGPARIAQARSHSGFDVGSRLAGPLALQPEQEQCDGDGGIVELKRAQQVDFQRTEIVISELEVEPLP